MTVVKGGPPLRGHAAIPEPLQDVVSLRATAFALKEGYEVLAGIRGDAESAAVTWRDLIQLGLVRADQVPNDVGSTRSRE